MEQKKRVKWWHRVVAFLVGYVAGGIAYVAIPDLLAILFTAMGNFPLSLEAVRSIGAFVGICIWILVYRYCIRNWWKEPATA